MLHSSRDVVSDNGAKGSSGPEAPGVSVGPILSGKADE